MKKIPTIFERDWNGDRSRVVDQVNPKARWVFEGEGWPTKKLDGTSCLIDGGVLYKRRELKKGEAEPSGFFVADIDEETGKIVGWVPASDGPEDRWHREAFDALPDKRNGTYELVGPKVQGNPEQQDVHALILHADGLLHLDTADVPRDFDGLRAWLSAHDVEGIVWHHPDGRMAKIKKRDFGLKR